MAKSAPPKSKKQRENSKGRLFKVVTYLEEQDILSSLNKINNLNYAYYCLHNRDLNKEPHTHIFLSVANSTTALTIQSYFKARDKPNTLIPEVSVDWRAEIRYLVHLDSKNKFKYEISDIKSVGSLTKLKSALRQSSIQMFDNATSCVFDIIEGMSTRALCEKYGRDFIYHYQSIFAIAQRIIDEESFLEERIFEDG